MCGGSLGGVGRMERRMLKGDLLSVSISRWDGVFGSMTGEI